MNVLREEVQFSFVPFRDDLCRIRSWLEHRNGPYEFQKTVWLMVHGMQGRSQVRTPCV